MAKKLFLTLKHVIFLMRLKHRQQKNQRLKFQNNRLKLLAYLQLKKHVQHGRVLINEVKQEVESIMKKSTSSFLNEPTEKVFLKFQKLYQIKHIALIILLILLRQNLSFQAINNKLNCLHQHSRHGVFGKQLRYLKQMI